MGDINCWGLEDKPTLENRQKQLNSELQLIDEFIGKCDNLDSKGITSLNRIPTESKSDFIKNLKQIVCLLGNRKERLRETEITLSRSDEKF